MKPLQLDALRDIAIEYIPRAQKTRDQLKGQSKDYFCHSLYATTIPILANAGTLAIEQVAAYLLQCVMHLSINLDNKLTATERKRFEGYAIEAANELCTFTGRSISWLPAALEETSEPEAPPAPAMLTQATPSIALPPAGINLTTAEAARLLNRQPQTLRGWASKDTGPLCPIRGGRQLEWPSDEVRRLMTEGWKTR